MTLETMDFAALRARLEDAPGVIEALLGALPTAGLHFRDEPGSWTPFEVLCHVTDAEEHNWIPRVRSFVEGDGSGGLPPFDREAGLRRYAEVPIDKLIAEFARRRRESLAAFDALALQPADFARQARHPELGTVTLGQLIATWVTHDHAHAAQICRALVRCYGAGAGPWQAFFRYLREG